MTIDADSARVREMIDGYRLSQAIFAATELSIAERLAQGPAHYEALAVASESDPRSLYRLLRALASADLLTEEGGGRFALTPLGNLLRPAADGSLHAWTRLSASLYRPWGELLHAVRTGKQSFEPASGKSRWQHLSENATESRVFNEAMAESSAHVAHLFAALCDLSRFRRIVDVGGGNGILLRTVLDAYPHSRGVLFDLPEALRDARTDAPYELVPGSFFEAVPTGGDAYVLSRVLHDWNDARAAEILRNTRRAMGNGAALFVIERILEPQRPGLEAALSDLSMMVMNGGRERTLAEFENLLSGAQCRIVRVATTSVRFQIIQAEAA